MTQFATLQDLLAPISIEQFLSHHWRRHTFLRKNVPQWVYNNLAPPDVIEELVAGLPLPAEDWISIVHDQSVPIGGSFIGPDNTIDLSALNRAYENGYSLLLRRLHKRRRNIGLVCRAIEKGLVEAGVALGDRVGANLYMTPPRSRGFRFHYDDHDVLILQLAGCKHWRIYEQMIEAPLEHGYAPQVPSKMPKLLHESELTSGDLLYLPSGFPHEARTKQRESVHLTFSLRPATMNDMLNALANHCVELRRALPLSPENVEAKHPIASVLRSLADQVESSDVLQHGLRDLELRTFKRFGVVPGHGFTQIDRIRDVNVNTIVTLRPDAFGILHAKPNTVDVLLPGNCIKCPERFYPALRRLFSGERVRAGDLPGLDQSERHNLFRTLLLAGALYIPDDSHDKTQSICVGTASPSLPT